MENPAEKLEAIPLGQVVLNYLKTTPEHLEKDGSGLIVIALMEAYSCN